MSSASNSSTAKLTHRQNQLVQAVLDPKHPTLSSAAKSVGMDVANAHRMLTKQDKVSEVVKAQRQRALDKTTGVASVLRKLGRAMREMTEDQFSQMEPERLLQMYGGFVKLQNEIGPPPEHSSDDEWLADKQRHNRSRLLWMRWTLANPHRASMLLERMERVRR